MMSVIDHSVTATPKVTVSRLFQLPVSKCWQSMRNFLLIPSLAPEAITFADQPFTPEQVGFIRNIDVEPHDLHIRETLRRFDDQAYTLAYDICQKNDSFLPGTSNYLAKYQFFAVGENQAFGYWEVYFDQEGESFLFFYLSYFFLFAFGWVLSLRLIIF
jgi:hypothetical protein